MVLELSSYQTDLARALTPDVAVFTNLSPDHLDRHGGVGGYFAAKRRLFAEGGPDRAVIGVDEAEGLFMADQLAEGPDDDRVIRVSVTRKLAGLAWSVHATQGLPRRDRGRAGRRPRSTCAASAACPARTTTRTPAPPMPRCEPSGSPRARSRRASGPSRVSPTAARSSPRRAGSRFVNDSKATNVDSAAQGAAGPSRGSAGSPAGLARRAASERWRPFWAGW